MKKGFILLIVTVLCFSSCVVQSQPKNKGLNEFSSDWATANFSLRGTLKLYGEYKGDLSRLTYASYLEQLQKNIKSSGKGIVELIKESERHVFAVNQSSFLIVIYSKRLNAVLYDDSNTGYIDVIHNMLPNEKVPDLNEFVRKTGFVVK